MILNDATGIELYILYVLGAFIYVFNENKIVKKCKKNYKTTTTTTTTKNQVRKQQTKSQQNKQTDNHMQMSQIKYTQQIMQPKDRMIEGKIINIYKI